ncbi:MAG: TRAP transporter small permease subunit [Pseudomonadota bacterium]
MSSISLLIDKLNSYLGKFVSFATILMALIMFAVVVLRYGFNVGWIAMQESITYLHAAVFLMGAAYTYQHDAHVRVDVFYRRFSARNKTLINLIGTLFFMLPTSVFITWACYDYVVESWKLKEASMEPGGLPFIYILKSFLLVFSLSLFLQAVSELIKHSLALITNEVSA